MAGMDNTTNAAFIPTIIANKALGYFAGEMNLAKTVSTNWDWTSATEGATIQVPKRGALSVNQKASNSNIVVQNPTATNVSVTLNKHPEVSFGLDDVTKVLENQNVLIGYAEDAAKVLAENIEASVAANYASLTATPVVVDTTSATTIDASIRKIRKAFVDAKVPVGEQRHISASSDLYNALLSVQQYVQAQNLATSTGNTPTVSGNVLPLFGLNFWETQLAPETGTTPSITDHMIAYTKNAMVLASRPLPQVPNGAGAVSEVIADENTGLGLRVTTSWDHYLMQTIVTLDCLLGTSVIDQRRAFEVQLVHA